jgi:hypothetical protein
LVAEIDGCSVVPGTVAGLFSWLKPCFAFSASAVDGPLLQAAKDKIENKAKAFVVVRRLKKFFISKFDFANEMNEFDLIIYKVIFLKQSEQK